MWRRQWKLGDQPIGVDVMTAGIVRKGASGGWLWFSHGFYGDTKTLDDAKGFVDAIIDSVKSGVELPGDGDATQHPPGWPRLITDPPQVTHE
jgi:hypothetical protein